MTQEGFEALKAELDELENVERPKIVERIKIAREWGDLKENSEYHDAKNSQGMLERKITMLQSQVKHAEIVESSTSKGEVGFGSTVELTDEESGKKLTYTLVGLAEADAAQSKISVDSPVGSAISGLKVGDTAVITTPRGERRLKVESIK